VADHRQLIDRVMKVVGERIEQAEKIGLQKLEQAERQGRNEFERAQRRHHRKLSKLERRRASEEKRSGRKRGGWRQHRADREATSDEPRPRRAARRTLTPEQRQYRAARRRANLRLLFFTHLAVYASVLTLLLVTTRSFRVVFIVALSWGIAVFLHYFWSMLAPSLRERWIQKEVGQRVQGDVSSERERVEHRHVRSLEDLSASIAHEIRNPITAAKSLVAQMGEDPVSRDNLEYANVALDELDRVERSISHLLRFARDEDLSFSQLEMAEVIRSAVETFRERIARQAIEVDCQLDTRGAMRGDADKLRRVLINLIGNAIDALEGAGTPEPKLTIMSGDNLAGTEVWVRVQDNGPGIDAETRRKVFDPFYTTKASGTGLGLALSKKVVDAHGGSLELDSSPSRGTEFVLSFPKEVVRAGGAQ
jgi:signal transduction histidine kinase